MIQHANRAILYVALKAGSWLFNAIRGTSVDGNADEEDAYAGPDDWLSLDVTYDHAVAQLNEQGKLWESADARLRLILGVIGLIFAASLGIQPRSLTYAVAVGQALVPGTPVVPVAPGTTAPVTTQTWTYPAALPTVVGALVIAAIGLFFLAGLIAAIAFWPTKFDRPPDVDWLRDGYLTEDPRRTKLKIVDTIIAASKKNEGRLERKFLAFKLAFLFTACASAALGIGVIVQIATETAGLPV